MKTQKVHQNNKNTKEYIEELGIVPTRKLVEVYKKKDYSTPVYLIRNDTYDKKAKFALRLKHIIVPYEEFNKNRSEHEKDCFEWKIDSNLCTFEIIKNEKSIELQKMHLFSLTSSDLIYFEQREVLKMSEIGSKNKYGRKNYEKVDFNLFYKEGAECYEIID